MPNDVLLFTVFDRTSLAAPDAVDVTSIPDTPELVMVLPRTSSFTVAPRTATPLNDPLLSTLDCTRTPLESMLKICEPASAPLTVLLRTVTPLTLNIETKPPSLVDELLRTNTFVTNGPEGTAPNVIAPF